MPLHPPGYLIAQQIVSSVVPALITLFEPEALLVLYSYNS
jgi:hypothetical protein